MFSGKKWYGGVHRNGLGSRMTGYPFRSAMPGKAPWEVLLPVGSALCRLVFHLCPRGDCKQNPSDQRNSSFHHMYATFAHPQDLFVDRRDGLPSCLPLGDAESPERRHWRRRLSASQRAIHMPTHRPDSLSSDAPVQLAGITRLFISSFLANCPCRWR